MDTSLPVIGPLLAAAAIPLIVYLYLRSREGRREARYQQLRDAISQPLASRIGEGRGLSAYEIRAVIDAKLRDYREAPGLTTVEEVIEDLVAETSTTLLLDGQRKEQIIENLRRIHEQLMVEGGVSASRGRPLGESLSTMFAWVAPVATLLVVLGGGPALQGTGTGFRPEPYLLAIVLGLAASLLGAIAAAALLFVGRLLARRQSARGISRDPDDRVNGVAASPELAEAAARLRRRAGQDATTGTGPPHPGYASGGAERAGEPPRG
jgi:hypothetical protein